MERSEGEENKRGPGRPWKWQLRSSVGMFGLESERQSAAGLGGIPSAKRCTQTHGKKHFESKNKTVGAHNVKHTMLKTNVCMDVKINKRDEDCNPKQTVTYTQTQKRTNM